MRSPVPLEIPGQMVSMSLASLGGSPGRRVVSERMMRDVVGPRENAGPQESARTVLVRAERERRRVRSILVFGWGVVT
jgi:hypothetical protein